MTPKAFRVKAQWCPIRHIYFIYGRGPLGGPRVYNITAGIVKRYKGPQRYNTAEDALVSSLQAKKTVWKKRLTCLLDICRESVE